ncbi:CLUMA_CG019654, isoform A [Clunio marinus]|uniref:CLUMA_CG019654, isoform A n=1 Tax=Clunio marinus TaxID=568069 RepID=A0A1J1J7N1_9DIPT|nr:CLUMA_CG019654, isoform A [Clunio marinus]
MFTKIRSLYWKSSEAHNRHLQQSNLFFHLDHRVVSELNIKKRFQQKEKLIKQEANSSAI